MATSVAVSSPPFLSRWSPLLPPIPATTQFKYDHCSRRFVLLRVRCSSSEPNGEQEDASVSASILSGISAYSWSAGLGGLGFVETGYLTYLKFTNSDAFCPIGGWAGSCGDVLNSDYAVVFGFPLPLIGMIAYGLVATLSQQLSSKDFPIGISDANGRLILLWTTTSMAAASAYFLYILSTKFSGTLCSYCLASALLSFSLFFITIKSFGLRDLQKEVGLQLCVVGLVLTGLTISYNSLIPASPSLAEADLPYFTVEITTQSSPLALSLAKHLHSMGAKMYGAFWCSHCLEQKEMFGREAAKLLDYVECFPEGYEKGITIAKACSDAGVAGFPMWVINGQVLSGQQELSELARASGFEFDGIDLPR